MVWGEGCACGTGWAENGSSFNSLAGELMDAVWRGVGGT